MKKYTLDNVMELLQKLQEDNRKLRELADQEAVNIDRVVLRLGIIQKQSEK